MTLCPACNSPDATVSWLGACRYKTFSFEFVACRRCGSLFMDPMPSDALLGELYSPEYLLSQGACPHDPPMRINAELADVMRELVLARPGASVLDIGCGAGEFLSAAQRAGLKPEGLERETESAAEVALATGVTVYSGSARSIRRSFDYVHIADVLEHSPNPLSLLEDSRSVMAQGGLVIARGPLENQRNFFQSATAMSRILRSKLKKTITEIPPYHVILFTLAGWHALLSRAGFRVEKERIYEARWPAPESFGAKSLVKTISMAVSNSRVGCAARFGNRVVTFMSSTGLPIRAFD